MDIVKELHKYEGMVIEKRYDEAFKQLLFLLKNTPIERTIEDKVFANLDNRETDHVATRLVSATFQLFLDKGFMLNEDGFQALAVYGRNFHTMVALTPFFNADHVMRHLLGQDEEGNQKENIDIYAFRKLMYLWSIYSEIELPFENFMKEHPEPTFYALCNALMINTYISEAVHMRRERFLEMMADRRLDFKLDDSNVAFVGPAWMYTTYATTERKHDAKIAINDAYRKWALGKGVKEPVLPRKRQLKERPTIVVIVEQMDRYHAMFRVYGDSLYALKERFNMVGMGIEGSVNENVYDAFHKFVNFPVGANNFKKYVGLVLKESPDIILYASLGMNNVTIPLANLRLAPIQMMFLGHPAPSRIKTMDYVVLEEGMLPNPDHYTERLVAVNEGDFVLRDTVDATDIAISAKEKRGINPKIVKVAIPSFAMKISDPFITVLEKIQKLCSKTVEYHFFPYLTGINHKVFSKEVHKRIPNAVVELPMSYKNYLTTLGACDLHFGPFPFSNSNGNIDSLKMRVPMLVLSQDTTEGSIDASMLRHMGAPKEVIAENIEEYIQVAVSLIEDVEYRRKMQAHFENLDLHKRFFNKGKTNEIVNAIDRVYKFHDLIVENDMKVIKPNELDEKFSLKHVAN